MRERAVLPVAQSDLHVANVASCQAVAMQDATCSYNCMMLSIIVIVSSLYYIIQDGVSGKITLW